MKQDFTIGGHRFDGLEAFLRVAERRNFRAAAEDLGISPSAVSQKIRALEERIGIPLLVRTTRSVGLTQAGQILLRRSAAAMAELSAAFDAARDLGEPAGVLRLNMPKGVIAILIEPILGEFCTAYPRIDLEIVSSDLAAELASDLVQAGYDAGVSLAEMLDNDTVALRLTDPIKFVIVGSPAYLDRHGRPQSLAELRDHSCIRLFTDSEHPANWTLAENGRPITVRVNGRLVSSDYGLCISAARQGLGLFYAAENLVEADLESGALETVLPSHWSTSSGLFLHYPSRAQVMPKLRVFIDFVRARLQR